MAGDVLRPRFPGPPSRRQRTRETLQRIADAVGVPIETFLEPGAEAPRPASMLVALLDDPHGLRIAEAFAGVEDPAGRRAIADAVCGIAGAFNMRKAAEGEGVGP